MWLHFAAFQVNICWRNVIQGGGPKGNCGGGDFVLQIEEMLLIFFRSYHHNPNKVRLTIFPYHTWEIRSWPWTWSLEQNFNNWLLSSCNNWMCPLSTVLKMYLMCFRQFRSDGQLFSSKSLAKKNLHCIHKIII